MTLISKIKPLMGLFFIIVICLLIYRCQQGDQTKETKIEDLTKQQIGTQSSRSTSKTLKADLEPIEFDDAKRQIEFFRNTPKSKREEVFSFSLQICDFIKIMDENSVNWREEAKTIISSDGSFSLLGALARMYDQEMELLKKKYKDRGFAEPTEDVLEIEVKENLKYLKFYNGLIEEPSQQTYIPTLVMVGASEFEENGTFYANDLLIEDGASIFQHTRPCPNFCNHATRNSPFAVPNNKRSNSRFPINRTEACK